MALDPRYCADAIKKSLLRPDSDNAIGILEKLSDEAFQNGRFVKDFLAADRGINVRIFIFTLNGEEYAITK